MPTLRRARLGRFAQVLSLLALSCALTAPGAHAAPAKKVAKKAAAKKTGVGTAKKSS